MARYLTILIIILLLFSGYLAYKFSKETTWLVPLIEEERVGTNLEKFNFQKWHEFSDPNGKFTVMFPTLPQHATENVNVASEGDRRKYEMYVAEKDDGTIFMISLITFSNPDATKDKDGLMRTMMNDMMASNPNNELKDMKTSKFKEYDALDYSFANSETRVDAKSFIIDDTLYMLTRVVKTQLYNPDEFNFFVNSFDLTNSIQKSE
jgi:hypothetical protein